MANAFLIQINERSYSRLTETQTYGNHVWSSKRRDRAQGEVEPGDTVLFYCTGDVPQYGLSLALRAPVESVEADKTVFHSDYSWMPHER